MIMLRSFTFILFINFIFSHSKNNTIRRLKESYYKDNEKLKGSYGRDVINGSMINSTKETIEFELQHCKCYRKLKKVSKISNLNETTCSMDAYHRGEGQKIVGFSYYRVKDKSKVKHKNCRGFHDYVKGIKDNLELMKKYYPGFVMRLYLEMDENHAVEKSLCKLACENPNLDLCDVKNLPGPHILKDAHKVSPIRKIMPALWRFFTTLDSQVDIFISRDLDSRINDRELAAVNEWLESEKPFHLIRDHIDHGHVPILAGLWGTQMINSSIRYNWIESWKNGLKDPALMFSSPESFGPDQTFLQRYVWPWVKDKHIAHDAYTCEKYPNTKPFPIERKIEPNNFASALPGKYTNLQCPIACRPKKHQEWKYC